MKAIFKRYRMFLSGLALYVLLLVLSSFLFRNINSTEFECFEDKSSNIAFDQISSQKFQAINDNHLNAGITKSVWWVRFKSENISNRQILVIFNSSIEKATLYAFDQRLNSYTSNSIGWEYTSNGTLNDLYYSFDIPGGTDKSKYIYLQLSSPYSLTSGLGVFSYEQYKSIEYKNLICIGFLLGLILTIFVYNLILFINIPEKGRSFFLLYMLISILFILSSNGVFWILSPAFAVWNQSTGVSLVYIYLVIIISTIYVRLHLNIEGKTEITILRIFAFLSLLGIALSLFGYKYLSDLFSGMFFIIFILFLIVVSARAVNRGLYYANYLFAGYLLCIISMLVTTNGLVGIIANRFVWRYSLLISTCFQNLFMTTGTVERVKIIKRQKEETVENIRLNAINTETKKLAAQKAQIDTALLFDAMKTSSKLCVVEPEKAVGVLLDLSDYFVYNFDFNSEEKLNNIENELEQADNYLRIKNVSSNGNTIIDYINSCTQKVLIPSMALFNIIEHAINRGFKSNAGKIVVRVSEYDKFINISVEDNGQAMTEEEISGIFAHETKEKNKLAQADLRIFTCYGTHLEISSTENIGTVITFSIPKER